MSLESVNGILKLLEIEAKLQEQPFQRLLKVWTSTVGSTIATHTQPVSIQRNVLWVATSSAAWAQNLTFERQRLLSKLNALLPTPLVDIRFSTAGWQRLQNQSQQHNQPQAYPSTQEHPSYLGEMPKNHGKFLPLPTMLMQLLVTGCKQYKSDRIIYPFVPNVTVLRHQERFNVGKFVRFVLPSNSLKMGD